MSHIKKTSKTIFYVKFNQNSDISIQNKKHHRIICLHNFNILNTFHDVFKKTGAE